MPTTATVETVLADLRTLADPRIAEVNRRHGDDHAVNLTRLRALARSVGTRPELARELWETGDSAARLVSLLICRPRQFEAEDLDRMLRQARTPKVTDWLVGYVVTKSPHRESLRRRWFDDPEPDVAAAGWSLTADRVVKDPTGLDLAHLLDLVEARMKDAPNRLQWAMNTTLAQIGITHPELRDRALAIGERLGVLKDYPTSPGCISPYAPIWITEMVARQG